MGIWILKVVGDGTSGGGWAGVPVALAGLAAASIYLRSAEISRSTPEENISIYKYSFKHVWESSGKIKERSQITFQKKTSRRKQAITQQTKRWKIKIFFYDDSRFFFMLLVYFFFHDSGFFLQWLWNYFDDSWLPVQGLMRIKDDFFFFRDDSGLNHHKSPHATPHV